MNPRVLLLRLSKLAAVLNAAQQEGQPDLHPHGLEGRILRTASPLPPKAHKLEGPRAYAPRL
jgi:hypothetical protein